MNFISHYINRIRDGAIKNKIAQIKWIYRFASPHALSIIIYTVLGLASTVVSLLTSLVSRDLVDIITGHQTGKLLTTFCIMVGVTLGTTFMSQLSGYISAKITISLDNYIKAEIFDEIMSSEWEYLNRYHSGELLVRWNSDVGYVSNGILTLIPNAIMLLFRFISTLWMVCRYDASFAIFAVASIPISMLISRESMKRMQKNNMSTMEINAKVSSFNQEAFSNVQFVKAFDMVSLYAKRLRALQKEYTEVRLKYQKNAIVNAMILTVLSMLVTYSAQGWGVYKVWSGAITYGTMTMFISLSATLSATANNIISLFPNSIMMLNAAKRLMDLSEMPKEDYSQKEAVKEFYNKHSEEGVGICVRGVSYAYGEGDTVFADASLDAHPHEVIALVGPSGEGKTTMMRFLLAIIRAKTGQAYLCGGKSLPEDGDCMDLTASVRQLMAYVPQGNTMFSGTIAGNMRNVKEDATDEEIIAALKMACAWKFVEKLPDGINSEILERGGGFSEGQAQRLSIARALLRRSPILLLDEATSALDVATEREVLRNIMADDYPRTCIVTTHRPTVLTSCDRVYAIRNQRCEQVGAEEIERMIMDF